MILIVIMKQWQLWSFILYLPLIEMNWFIMKISFYNIMRWKEKKYELWKPGGSKNFPLFLCKTLRNQYELS